MILEYANRTTYTYDKMVTNHRWSKQSEKAIKTEALRKLKPQERGRKIQDGGETRRLVLW